MNMELKFVAGTEWLIVKQSLQASLAKNEKEISTLVQKEAELKAYEERELADLVIKRDILIKLIAQIA
jgi:hypothetical protein